MDKRQKDLLARVLDMNEIELRATLITILNFTWAPIPPADVHGSIYDAIDAAYNPIRRTGIPKEVLNKL